MSGPVKLPLSPPLLVLRREAERMGVSFPSLLTAELVRWRGLAAAAVPADLSAWDWQLLGHVLDGIEAHGILSGSDDLPSPARIVAEIDDWADHAGDEETLAAGALRAKVLTWSPSAVAGVLIRLRRE